MELRRKQTRKRKYRSYIVFSLQSYNEGLNKKG